MLSHTRAMIAAATFALVTGKKVAGLHDHAQGRDLRIAAESRGDQLQGFDGERQVKFNGRLPEIYDAGDKVFVALQVEGTKAHGHDRASGTSFSVEVKDGLVQVYDHGAQAWFTYDVQNPDAAMSYYRTSAPA